MSRSGPDPEFDFVSRWQLATGPGTVWDALVDFHSWPGWWPGLVSVEETAPGGEDGIGQRAKSVWRGPVGYKVDFEIETVERRHPEVLLGDATFGLAGSGTWHLSPVEGGAWTQFVYEWKVVATRRWMRMLNPVARPVFVRSHDHVMNKGAVGLAAYLGCEIRDFSTGEETKA